MNAVPERHTKGRVRRLGVWGAKRAILYHPGRYSGKSVARRGGATPKGGATTDGCGLAGVSTVVSYPVDQLAGIARLGLGLCLEGLWGTFWRPTRGFTGFCNPGNLEKITGRRVRCPCKPKNSWVFKNETGQYCAPLKTVFGSALSPSLMRNLGEKPAVCSRF